MKKQKNLLKGIIYSIIGLLVISILLAILAYAWPFLLASIPLYLKFSKQENTQKKRNTAIGIGIAAALSFSLFIFAGSGNKQNIETETSSNTTNFARSLSLPESTISETDSSIFENTTVTTESQSVQETESIHSFENQTIQESETTGITREEIIKAAETESQKIVEEKAAQEESLRTTLEESSKAAESEAQQIEQEATLQNTASRNENNFNTYDNPEQQNTSETYVLNTSTMKFHYPHCSSVKQIAPHNYATSSTNRDDLISQGYSPCGRCKP